jgi:hypothetical protein
MYTLWNDGALTAQRAEKQGGQGSGRLSSVLNGKYGEHPLRVKIDTGFVPVKARLARELEY